MWMLIRECGIKRCLFLCKKFSRISKILSVCFSWEIVWISGSAARVSRFPTYLYQTSKPALSCLRCLGHTVLAFIDDTLLQGDTEQDCQSAMMATCQVFNSLGFTVHPVKSVLQPTQRIKFLGFWLDSVNMIVSLTDRKVDLIRSVCAVLLKMEVCCIRHTAEIIGYLVSAHPGVWVAPVFHRRMEIAKKKCSSFWKLWQFWCFYESARLCSGGHSMVDQ